MLLDLDILIKMALGGVGIWTLYYKRTEILAITHKDFTAKLDSTIRFYRDFFDNVNVNKLVLDRAAQELARLDYVDYDFICYLIKLHDARLIDLDQMIRLYRSGRKFIVYTPQNEVTVTNFKMKIKDGRSVKKQVFYFAFQYVFFAMLIILPLVFSKYLPNLSQLEIPFFAYFFAGSYFLGCFILSFIGLLDSGKIQDAETFLEKLNEADIQYQSIMNQQVLEESNKNLVSNYSEYQRR